MLYSDVRLFIADVDMPYAGVLQVSGMSINFIIALSVDENNMAQIMALPLSRLNFEPIPVKVVASDPRVQRPNYPEDYLVLFEGLASVDIVYDKDTQVVRMSFGALVNTLYTLSSISYSNLSLGSAFSTVESAQDSAVTKNINQATGAAKTVATSATPVSSLNSLIFQERLLIGAKKRKLVETPADIYEFTLNNLLQPVNSAQHQLITISNLYTAVAYTNIKSGVNEFIEKRVRLNLGEVPQEDRPEEKNMPISELDLCGTTYSLYNVFAKDLTRYTGAIGQDIGQGNSVTIMEALYKDLRDKGVWFIGELLYTSLIGMGKKTYSDIANLVKDTKNVPSSVKKLLAWYFTNGFNSKVTDSRVYVSSSFSGIKLSDQVIVARSDKDRKGNPPPAITLPPIPLVYLAYSSAGKSFWTLLSQITVFDNEGVLGVRLIDLLGNLVSATDPELNAYGITREQSTRILALVSKTLPYLDIDITNHTKKAVSALYRISKGKAYQDSLASNNNFNLKEAAKICPNTSGIDSFVTQGSIPEEDVGSAAEVWGDFWGECHVSAVTRALDFVKGVEGILNGIFFLPSAVEPSDLEYTSDSFKIMETYFSKWIAEVNKSIDSVNLESNMKEYGIFDIISATSVYNNSLANRFVTFGCLRTRNPDSVMPNLKLKDYSKFRNIIQNIASSQTGEVPIKNVIDSILNAMYMRFAYPLNKVKCNQINKLDNIKAIDNTKVVPGESVSEVLMLPSNISTWAIPKSNVIYLNQYHPSIKAYNAGNNATKFLLKYNHSLEAQTGNAAGVPATYFIYDVYAPENGLIKTNGDSLAVNYAYNLSYDRSVKVGYLYQFERVKPVNISSTVALYSRLMRMASDQSIDITVPGDKYTSDAPKGFRAEDMLEFFSRTDITSYKYPVAITSGKLKASFSIADEKLDDFAEAKDKLAYLIRDKGRTESPSVTVSENKMKDALEPIVAFLEKVAQICFEKFTSYEAAYDGTSGAEKLEVYANMEGRLASLFGSSSWALTQVLPVVKRYMNNRASWYEKVYATNARASSGKLPLISTNDFGTDTGGKTKKYYTSFKEELKDLAGRVASGPQDIKNLLDECSIESRNFIRAGGTIYVGVTKAIASVKDVYLPTNDSGFSKTISFGYQKKGVDTFALASIAKRAKVTDTRGILNTRTVNVAEFQDWFGCYVEMYRIFLYQVLSPILAAKLYSLLQGQLTRVSSSSDLNEILAKAVDDPAFIATLCKVTVSKEGIGEVTLEENFSKKANSRLANMVLNDYSASPAKVTFELPASKPSILTEDINSFETSDEYYDSIGDLGRTLMTGEAFVKSWDAKYRTKARYEYRLIYFVAGSDRNTLPNFPSLLNLRQADYHSDKTGALYIGTGSNNDIDKETRDSRANATLFINNRLRSNYTLVVIWSSTGTIINIGMYNFMTGDTPIMLYGPIGGPGTDTLSSSFDNIPAKIASYIDKINPFNSDILRDEDKGVDKHVMAPIPLSLFAENKGLLKELTNSVTSNYFATLGDIIEKSDPYKSLMSWDPRALATDTFTKAAAQALSDGAKKKQLVASKDKESKDETNAFKLMCARLFNNSGNPSSVLALSSGYGKSRNWTAAVSKNNVTATLHNGQDVGLIDPISKVALTAPCDGYIQYYVNKLAPTGAMTGYGLYAIFLPKVDDNTDVVPVLLLGHMRIKETFETVEYLLKQNSNNTLKTSHMSGDKVYNNFQADKKPEQKSEDTSSYFTPDVTPPAGFVGPTPSAIRNFINIACNEAVLVTAGTIIGIVGASGTSISNDPNSDGSHLHLTVIPFDKTRAYPRGGQPATLQHLKGSSMGSPRVINNNLAEAQNELGSRYDNPLYVMSRRDFPNNYSWSSKTEGTSERISRVIVSGVDSEVNLTALPSDDIIRAIAENKAHEESFKAYAQVQVPPVELPYYDPYFIDGGFPMGVCYKDDIVITSLSTYTVRADTNGIVRSTLQFGPGVSVRKMLFTFFKFISSKGNLTKNEQDKIEDVCVFPFHVIDYFNETFFSSDHMESEYKAMFGYSGSATFDWRRCILIDINLNADNPSVWSSVYELITSPEKLQSYTESDWIRILSSTEHIRVDLTRSYPEFEPNHEKSLMLNSRSWGPNNRYTAVEANRTPFNPKQIGDPYLPFDPNTASTYEANAQSAMSQSAEDNPAESKRTFYDWKGIFEYLKGFIR